jgi:hypothetical protein
MIGCGLLTLKFFRRDTGMIVGRASQKKKRPGKAGTPLNCVCTSAEAALQDERD